MDTKRGQQRTRSGEAIQVFFDGDCPLCRREVAFLTKRDSQGLIVATDIAAPSFEAAQYARSHTDFMATIQGRLADGQWISGVEVFRQLYAAVGFKRLVRVSRVRPIAWALNHAYLVFAKHRLRLTGRCSSSACRAPFAAANDNRVQTGAANSLESQEKTPSPNLESDRTSAPLERLVRDSQHREARAAGRLRRLYPSLPLRSLKSRSRGLN